METCAGLAGRTRHGCLATWTYLCAECPAQRAVLWQGSELLLLKIPLISVPVVDLPLAGEPRGSSSSAGQRKKHVGESGKAKAEGTLGELSWQTAHQPFSLLMLGNCKQ